MSRQPPRQKPGKSETVVRTPPEFLTAAKTLLGIDDFTIDLAASVGNAVCAEFYTKEQDALQQDWFADYDGWRWLNPPYDNIAPWAEMCAAWGVQTALLVPASVGSNWWRDNVHGIARVKFLNGRISFLDKFGKPIVSPKTGKPTPYPKDLALVLYGVADPGYDVWSWRK